MPEGLIFIPKYVRQRSDLAYGEKVTHENFNEKLNLNTTQGDYNTDVLFRLFTNRDKEQTYHIPYLDKDIEDVNNSIEDIQESIQGVLDDNVAMREELDTMSTTVDNIVDGTTAIAYATEAGSIRSGSTAGPSKYYGTNANSELGFIPLPDFIYATEVESSVGVDGIYFTPALNSVIEAMLSAEVREKLNRSNITDYDYLSNRPQINSIILTGNKSLSDLGIQPAGSYVTTTSLNTTLGSYYTKTQTDNAISTALNGNATQSWVNTQLSNYATTSSLNSVSAVANAAAKVQVGSTWSGSVKNGDILITL